MEPPVNLQLIETSDTLTHVALSGRLDIEGLHEVDLKFHAATASRGVPSVVDFTRVEFVASLGMGMLLSCARSLSRKGAAMAIYGASEFVADTLRAAGIDQGIPLVATLEEAKAAVGVS
ncbi:MAG: STAS domain-containing protein [Planctomycetota bacterium]|nr:STAS domain-containing protein [Planctomycetota bacterium]